MPARVVVDTNASLRLFSKEWSAVRRAIRQERLIPVTSKPLIEELTRVTSEPKFQTRIPPETRAGMVKFFQTQAMLVEPAADLPACRDANDLPLIGTAIAGQAEYLVTSDKDVLGDPELVDALAAHHIKVLSGSQFVSLIEAEG